MALSVNMPILVVDDHSAMARIIRDLLKRIGFHDVDVVSDGIEALDKLRQRTYGLAISDWNMEGMTGYELLCRVRSDRALHSMPFILVTAEAKLENVVVAKAAGVSSYLVKPFSAQSLKEKIEAIFADNSFDKSECEKRKTIAAPPLAEQQPSESDVHLIY